jgi:hypothetical protein
MCAFAMLSNHFHLVLRVDKARAEEWDAEEVMRRYGKLFRASKAQLELLTGRARAERIAMFACIGRRKATLSIFQSGSG